MKYLAIAATAIVMGACGSNEKASAETSTSPEPTEAAEPQMIKEIVDQAAATADATGVVELNDDNIVRPGKAMPKVTFLDFNATWCVPCKKFAPVFDEAAGKYDDVSFISVDIDKNPETAQAFGISVVPTVIVLGKDGKELKRFEGTGDLLPAQTFFGIVESVK